MALQASWADRRKRGAGLHYSLTLTFLAIPHIFFVGVLHHFIALQTGRYKHVYGILLSVRSAGKNRGLVDSLDCGDGRTLPPRGGRNLHCHILRIREAATHAQQRQAIRLA